MFVEGLKEVRTAGLSRWFPNRRPPSVPRGSPRVARSGLVRRNWKLEVRHRGSRLLAESSCLPQALYASSTDAQGPASGTAPRRIAQGGGGGRLLVPLFAHVRDPEPVARDSCVSDALLPASTLEADVLFFLLLLYYLLLAISLSSNCFGGRGEENRAWPPANEVATAGAKANLTCGLKADRLTASGLSWVASLAFAWRAPRHAERN
ncbi:hypothetical protein GQ53DRAFT_467303 [Thozetella sp. PMI_491]|nr:hypothetical protein GQ53DRAFT_467303 [Thozetella sp. PMI_491]